MPGRESESADAIHHFGDVVLFEAVQVTTTATNTCQNKNRR